jgi:hypothetical protein
MLQRLAAHRGMRVERRKIDIAECAEFEEVAGCGTAVVLAPCSRIVRLAPGRTLEEAAAGAANPGDVEYTFPSFTVCQALYDQYRAIQTGDQEDLFGWTDPVDQAAYRTTTLPSERKLVVSAPQQTQQTPRGRRSHVVARPRVVGGVQVQFPSNGVCARTRTRTKGMRHQHQAKQIPASSILEFFAPLTQITPTARAHSRALSTKSTSTHAAAAANRPDTGS